MQLDIAIEPVLHQGLALHWLRIPYGLTESFRLRFPIDPPAGGSAYCHHKNVERIAGTGVSGIGDINQLKTDVGHGNEEKRNRHGLLDPRHQYRTTRG